jgi:transcriptional regulator of heat shock response
MKAFIDKIFKKRKKDVEQIEENKAILSEQIETAIKNKVAQTTLEDIIKEADRIIVEELKQAEVFTKPGHYFNDCNCVKCVRWRSQNAK